MIWFIIQLIANHSKTGWLFRVPGICLFHVHIHTEYIYWDVHIHTKSLSMSWDPILQVPMKPFVCVENSRFRLAGAIGQGHHFGLEVRGTNGVSGREPVVVSLRGMLKKKTCKFVNESFFCTHKKNVKLVSF